MREAIASHDGNLYVMFADSSEAVDTTLQKLGLRRRAESCERVHTTDAPPISVMPRVVFCPVTRGPS